MKNIPIFKITALILCCVAFLSCASEDLQPELQLRSPYGQWRLEGFAAKSSSTTGYTQNANQGYSIEKVTSSRAEAYMLILKNDGTFSGTSSANEISGTFTIHPERGNITFGEIVGTKLNETAEGRKYLDSLSKVTDFAVFENTLYLYYTKDKSLFLIFKAVDAR